MHELLKKLSESNVKIDLIGDNLDIQAPKGAMNADLLCQIKLHKDELIAFIKSHKSKITKHLFIPKAGSDESYPISSSQRRLWLLNQQETEITAYNMPSAFVMKGNLSISSLAQAFGWLIDRHESLRTRFVEDGQGQVRQLIIQGEEVGFQLQYQDLSLEDGSEHKARERIKSESKYEFDLSRDCLLRALLIKTGADSYFFIWVIHHIICDGVSAQILREELFALYAMAQRELGNELPAPSLQYKDFACWQQEMLRSEQMNEHKTYWQEQFSGEVPVLDLPTYQIRPAIKSFSGKTIDRHIARQDYTIYKQLCQTHESTDFMGMLALVKILLHRYTHQSDIVIGSPIAGRFHADLENQIGLYINTIALKTTLEGEDSFEKVLYKIKQTTLGAYEHEMYPYDELIEQLSLNRDRSRNPLFDVMVTYEQDKANTKHQTVDKLEIREYDGEEEVTSKFDINFAFEEKEGQLYLRLTYNTDLYVDDFIHRIFGHVETLMQSIVSNTKEKIAHLDYLTETEKHQLLFEFNDTKIPYPKYKTIIDLFEEQVEKTPDTIAVVFEEVELSYRALNERANQLGKHLNRLGVLPGSRIVLCFDSHLEKAIIGILATWKLGATYVPIDPDSPHERVRYIIDDAEANFILTTSNDAPINLDPAINILCLDVVDIKESDGIDYINQIKGEENAYVIYTSGTTGTPKGVLVSHRNIVDYLFGLSAKIKIEENTSFGLMSTISTDLGNTVLFSALISGRKLHLFSKDRLRDIEYIQLYFNKYVIDCIKIVPSYWNSLGINGNHISPSKMIIFGGEQVSNETVNKIKSEKPDLKIINHYGPTETTIGKLLHVLDSKKVYNRVPIGKAFSNTQLYIVDDTFSLCSIGVKGELLIGGDGVSRGYLNNAVLTNEKFIDNIFLTNGSKLYRTGDLVIMDGGGNIEFIGRKDKQIKILGHRIELLEIENALNNVEGIKTSVVTAVESINGNTKIIAYIIYEKNEIDRNEVFAKLRLSLPGIMIPSVLIKIEAIPFLSNGKIDYKSLPDSNLKVEEAREIIVPKNETEQKILTIWKEILAIKNLGVTDNFFEFGGNSLMVGQIINRIYKELNKSITFKAFFLKPTIEEIAKNLKSSTAYLPIPLAAEAESYPVTSSQNRLWILSQFEGGSTAYNMPIALKFIGKIDLELFQNAFDKVIQRHEILRTCFKINSEGELRQYINPFVKNKFKIEQVDFRYLTKIESEIEIYLQSLNEKPFDLDQNPLLKAAIIKTTEKESIFFLTKHHIIGDGWSSQIFISEIVKTYNAFVHNKKFILTDLSIQFKDYAVWHTTKLQTEDYKELEKYWLGQFSGELPIINLPGSTKRPPIQTYNGDSLTYKYSSEFLDNIKTFSKKYDVTLFMTLMATINVLVFRYTDQEDIIIGTPVAGREHPDLENQLGLFLNTLALRTKLNRNGSFLENMALQKDVVLGAFEHQNYPFDALVNKLNLKRDISRPTLFNIFLILQNQTQIKSIVNEEELLGLKIEEFNYSRKTSQFDMCFNFSESNQLELTIEFNTDIFNKDLVHRIFVHFENLLSQFIINPDVNIMQIDYLSKEERHQLLFEYNDTNIEDIDDKTIIDEFKNQVVKTPNNIAIKDDRYKYTYDQLDKFSDRITQFIFDTYGMENKNPIGVLMSRSSNLVILLLSILKSGRPYIPLDPSYPENRINYILEDSLTNLLITDQEYLSYNFAGVHIETFENIVSQINVNNTKLEKRALPYDTAYIIYTSGSTGRPKGVEIGHISLLNFMRSIRQKPGIISHDVLFSVTTFCFDISILEFFAPLISGASLYIATNEILANPNLIIEKLNEIQPTIIQSTPSFYQMLFQAEWKGDKKTKLLCGGDLLSESLAEKLINHSLETWNMYGPTETTIWSSMKKLEKPDEATNIGKPINNTQIYILDSLHNLKPKVAFGEIFISGLGLAKGYYRNEPLTKEKFILNPFNNKSLIYDTGDIGKWNSNGEIEIVGRKDFQVKIRGFRIELGEIENEIQQYEKRNISQVVVVVREIINEKALIAYYTVNKTNTVDKSELRTYLYEKLPEYMVPNYFVELQEIPLTLNGKVDRKALPDVTGQDLVRRQYIAPRDQYEQKIVNIWEQILGVEKIGITDNFFELGGHSLLIAQILNRTHKELSKQIGFKEFFNEPTIEGMSNNLKLSDFIPIPISNIQENYPLSPNQKRLWIISNFKGGNLAYNITDFFSIDSFDKDKIINVFNEIINENEILRTNFVYDSRLSDIRQIISSYDSHKINDLKEIDYSEIGRIDPKSIFNKVFDLKKDSLIRIFIIKNYSNEFIVVFNAHHIILDGNSMKILKNLFIDKYYNKNSKTQASKIQYKDYTAWLNNYLLSDKMNNDKIYWLHEFEHYDTSSVLSFAKQGLSVKNYDGDSIDISFENNTVLKIQKYLKNRNISFFTFLFTVMSISIRKVNNSGDFVIGFADSGRVHQDIENMLGMFVNTLPIKVHIKENNSFEDTLNHINDKIISALEHNYYPFDILIEDLKIKKDLSKIPLINVATNYEEFSEDSFVVDDSKSNLEIKVTSHFDIIFSFIKFSNAFHLTLIFNVEIFEKNDIQQISLEFQNTLNNELLKI